MPTKGIEVVEIRQGAPEWAMDIIRYIDTNELLDNRWEARKI